MKKLSLAKIIAALVIVNCYMFTCGVMGTVGDAQMLTEDIPSHTRHERFCYRALHDQSYGLYVVYDV